MFSRELTEEILRSTLELHKDVNVTGIEIAVGSDVGFNKLLNIPVVFDGSLPVNKLQLRYLDWANRPHIVKEIDAGVEFEAINVARRMVRIGPHTLQGMLADYDQRKAVDDELIAESKRQLEAGEITEDEMYTGSMPIGLYMLTYETDFKIMEKKLGVKIPISISQLKEAWPQVESLYNERARQIIQDTAASHLRLQGEK